MEWRYIASRLNGNGTETFLSYEVPISGLELDEVLSLPGGISGTIEPEIKVLIAADGRPLFESWSTALYVEQNGRILGSGIFVDTTAKGAKLQLNTAGWSMYPSGMPYVSERSYIQADPMDVYRDIWGHLQSQPQGNLGMTFDQTKSTKKIGTAVKQNDFTTGSGENVSFESGPYKLNWFSTFDLGKEAKRLANETPFEYVVDHSWNANGTIKHHMRMGLPTLGTRRHDIRFIVGTNVYAEPKYDFDGDTYANEVTVLGAGTGRLMRRGDFKAPTKRLRRAKVIESKAITSNARATDMAEREVRRFTGAANVTSITALAYHPTAPLGNYELGDEVLLQNFEGWMQQDVWVRIIGRTIKPESSEVDLTVMRTDRMSS